MSARMEKVREALRPGLTPAEAIAALAEVEEWETRLVEAERFAAELERQNENLADALATDATDREVEHYNRAVAAEARADTAEGKLKALGLWVVDASAGGAAKETT